MSSDRIREINQELNFLKAEIGNIRDDIISKQYELEEKEKEQNKLEEELDELENNGEIADLLIRVFCGKSVRHQDKLIGQIITILHEYGHYILVKELVREIRKLTVAEQLKIHLYDIYGEQDWEKLLRKEVNAWDRAWKMAVKFGLDKNKRFETAFCRYKCWALKRYMEYIKSRKFMRCSLVECV